MRARWLSRRAVSLHARLVFLVVGFSVATWWQLSRALSGHGLSWFYTFEWPAFSLLAIAGWWHLIHEDPEHFRERKERRAHGEELEDPYRRAA